jgi:ArsR family transcriptional regulator
MEGKLSDDIGLPAPVVAVHRTNSHWCDMDTASAVALMAMLGHRLRIEIWRALLPYKSSGLSAGVISAEMDIAPSSLSFHLQQMVKAGILALRHDGRYTIYSVNTEIIVALCDYLANAVGNSDQRSGDDQRFQLADNRHDVLGERQSQR